MARSQSITEPPEDLLQRLAQVPELQPFSLAFYDRRFLLQASDEPDAAVCGNGENPFCNPACYARRAARLGLSENSEEPTVIECPGKMRHCLVPCRDLDGERAYLLIGGTRSEQIDLAYLEELASLNQVPALPMLERWSRLPHATESELLAAGRMARDRLLPPAELHRDPQPAATGLDTTLIDALYRADRVLAQATDWPTLRDAINSLLEPAFGPRSVSLLIFGDEDPELPCLESWPPASPQQDQRHSNDSEDPEQITCLPLSFEDRQLGNLLCFGPAPSSYEMQLLTLLAERIGSRLQRLGDSPVTSQISAFESKEFGHLLSLSQPEELCRQILRNIVQRIPAEKASMLLLSGSGQKLHLMASIGMNRAMATNLSIPADQGIAGRVMRDGEVLLVEDMERDPRIGTPPRPRYKSGSFLCAPLSAGSKHHGVICLADHKDDRPFAREDMELLTALTGPSAVLIERLRHQHQMSKLRDQAALDPATGVYNKTMFRRRFEEEVCRSGRLRQDLTLLLLSLDQPGRYLRQQARDLTDHLRGLLRKMDVVGRLEANLFTVLLPGTTSDTGLSIVGRLYDQRRNRDKGSLPTFSCGIASYPDNGASYELLLQSARNALGKASGDGGGRALVCKESVRNEKIVFL